ncbi:MAG: ABC transporter permease subunit [Bacteroidetes bacterium]|nr:ABC transporter permease subunit [Bacteroidota bacterium]
MLSVTGIELYKVFTRKRSYICFAAILIIVMITMAAIAWEGQDVFAFLTQNLAESFYMQGNLINGYMASYLVLNFLWVHIPLLIVIVTGDLLAGEANAGTYRVLLTRPVSRVRLVTAKFIAGIIYALITVLFLAVLSMGLGYILFGKGDLIVLMGVLNIFPEDDVFWRFVMAYIFGFLSMAAVASLSILLSGLSNNSLGPILSTMAVIIIFTLISSLDIELFAIIKPFLFTTYLNTWQLFFSFDIDRGEIMKNAVVLAGYVVIFYGITVFYFNRKDILT